MYTYKNETENDLVLPNVGFIKAGQTVQSSRPIENPNLTSVSDQVVEPTPQQTVAEGQPQPDTNNQEGDK